MARPDEGRRISVNTRTAGEDYLSEYIQDTALEKAKFDQFEHSALAAELAHIACGCPTPYSIAVYGPWGSGKTSLGALLKEALSNAPCRFARFDARKYADEPLKRHFITQMAHELGIKDERFGDGLYRTETKSTPPSLHDIARSFGKFFVLAVAVFTVVLAIATYVKAAFTEGVGFLSALVDSLIEYWTSLIISGSMVAILVSLFGQLGMVTRRREPPVNEELEGRFRDLVATTLKRKTVDGKRPQRLVLLIDEIDRCRPDRVVVVLDTLRTFLGVPRCVYVVPADREFLESAIQEALSEQTREKPGPAGSAAGEYLEKIFQHQLTLPPLHTHRLSDYALKLVASKGGVWAAARERGIMDELITVLLPTHVRNPRRAKALLNGFVSLYRSADSRRARRDDCPDPQELILEIAKLSTLQLEFPQFFADIRRFSQLAAYLDEVLSRQEDGYSIPTDLERRVRHFEGLHDALERWLGHKEEKPLGQDLLIRYLERTAIVPAPRSDLVYMESPAAPYHLDYSTAEECLNLALDRQSDQLCALLAEHDDVVGSAVEYLSSEVRHRRGIDRDNILDSLLALVETKVIEPSALDASCVKILAEQVRRNRYTEGRLPTLVRVASHVSTLHPVVRQLLQDPSLLDPEQAIHFAETLDALVEAAHMWKPELSQLLVGASPGTISKTLPETRWDSSILEAVFSEDAIDALSSTWVANDSYDSEAIEDFAAVVSTASTCKCASLLWRLLSLCNKYESTLLLATWLDSADVVPNSARQTELAVEAILYVNHDLASTLAEFLEQGPPTQSSILFRALETIRQWALEEGATDDMTRIWAALQAVWHRSPQVPDDLPDFYASIRFPDTTGTQDNRLAAYALLYEAQEAFDRGTAILSLPLLEDYASFVRNPGELNDTEIASLVEASAVAWVECVRADREKLNLALQDESAGLREAARRFWRWTLALALASQYPEALVDVKQAESLVISKDPFDLKTIDLWIRSARPSSGELRSLLSDMREASPHAIWSVGAAVAVRLGELAKREATDILIDLASWEWPTSEKSLKLLYSVPLDEQRFGNNIASMLRNARRKDFRHHLLKVWNAWGPDANVPRQALARALTTVVRRRSKGDLALVTRYIHLVIGAPAAQSLAAAMRGSAKTHPELKQMVRRSLKEL